MNRYIVSFDPSNTNYYQSAVQELESRQENEVSPHLGYTRLVDLFDPKAVVDLTEYDHAEERLEQILETVHHYLLFPSKYTVDNLHELGETLAGCLNGTRFVVGFYSEKDANHMKEVADKHGLPTPVGF